MSLPASYSKIQVQKISSDFRAATAIITVPLPTALKAGSILVRNEYVGVNASDINYTAGKYLPGVKVPFDAGFEGVGTVIKIGEGVKAVKVGDTVAYTSFGAYAEYVVLPARGVVKFDNMKPLPQLLPLLVSGLTASLALQYTGEMPASVAAGQKQKIILITAAAGATGLFAVQLAKIAGHHVIATVSNSSKGEELKKLGVDRVVNYKQESLATVLKNEYKRGVDIVYESVGGEMFDVCVRNLAQHGKLIVIGFISGYESGAGWKAGQDSKNLDVKPLILGKSASIRGFFLNDFSAHAAEHASRLTSLIAAGKLVSYVDSTKTFVGLEQVPDAIEHIYKGLNVGKVVVKINHSTSSKL